jgi:hypothetical protein
LPHSNSLTSLPNFTPHYITIPLPLPPHPPSNRTTLLLYVLVPEFGLYALFYKSITLANQRLYPHNLRSDNDDSDDDRRHLFPPFGFTAILN